MKGFAAWFKTFALGLGGLGLFAVAFVDSSFLTLPEINDVLIVVLVTRHPGRLVYYAAMQALGSVAGSFVLYWLARKGGEAFLRKRFSAHRVERATRTDPPLRRSHVAGFVAAAAAHAVQAVRPAGRRPRDGQVALRALGGHRTFLPLHR